MHALMGMSRGLHYIIHVISVLCMRDDQRAVLHACVTAVRRSRRLDMLEGSAVLGLGGASVRHLRGARGASRCHWGAALERDERRLQQQQIGAAAALAYSR
jgi:hypothetical protein